MLGVKKKRAIDNLDFDVDFSEWLVDGDALESATVVTVDDLVVGVVELIGDNIKVWLSGGTVGKSYEVKVTAVTMGVLGAGKRTKQEAFSIRITDC